VAVHFDGRYHGHQQAVTASTNGGLMRDRKSCSRLMIPQWLDIHGRCFFARRSTQSRAGLLIALVLLVAGCSSRRPIAFQNDTHRKNYSLTLQDLQKLQFFISRDVVAQYQDASGTKSLLLSRMTPGVVTSAGPNWLKVSFRDGGVDVPFVTDLNQYDGRYWLATEVEGQQGFKRIGDLADKIFLYQGVKYTVVQGGDALLLFDWDRWNSLVRTRKVTEGRRVN
jgi:hypothetical protein